MQQNVYSSPANCRACGAVTKPWLDDVSDWVYGVKGRWCLNRCSDQRCQAVYLDAQLTAEQIALFYSNYSTHTDPVQSASGLKLGYRQMLGWILHAKLGYARPEAPAWTRAAATVLGVFPYFRHAALARAYWLEAKPKGRLCEIGFGNAQALLQLRDLGWQVSGVEFDPVCIAKAKEFDLDVRQGSFEDQLFDDASLDAVVGSHVIEHVPDPGALMASIHRKLSDGGVMTLVTPNANSLGCRVFGRHWRGLECPRHLTVQTAGSLATLARAAGFAKVEVFSTPLGGGILQQSYNIRRQEIAAGRQGYANRFGWGLIASLVNLFAAEAAEEIVLLAKK